MNHANEDRSWDVARSRLLSIEPDFYEVVPGGSLAMDLGDTGWLLEITPDGGLICQCGMVMEDIMNLLSDGTPEGLGPDELAKQARIYLKPSVAKFRPAFLRAGFEERAEMTESYVAASFHKAVDLENIDDVVRTIRWCRTRFLERGRG